jgi:hypothetical protein
MILKTIFPKEISIFQLALCTLIYRVLLDLVFWFYLDPKYGYMGFELNQTIISFLASYFGLFLIFCLLPRSSSAPSSIVYQFFFLMVYVPFTSYYGMANTNIVWFILFTLFWVLVGTTIQLIKPPKLEKQFQLSKKMLLYVLIGFCIFVFGLIFYFGKIHFNLDILKVYELRALNPMENVPFGGYLINWCAKIVLPFLILFSWVYFKGYIRFASIFFMGLLFLLFSITGVKVYLFSIPVVIGLYLLLKTKHFLYYFQMTLILLVFSGLLLALVFQQDIIASFLVRRTLFIPAQLSFYYYDFFNGEPLYLSNSIFKSLIHYPYELDPSHMIAKDYFNKPEMSANNGIISDGFMHFGIIGILFWSLLFSALLKLIDGISANKNPLFIIPIVLLSFKTMMDAAFLTSILTHGIIVLLFLVYLLPNHIQYSTKN